MTINELINNKNIESMIKDIYIPVEDKKYIALEVLENCMVEDNGYIQIDRFKRDIYFDFAMLREYTDLMLSYDFDSMLEEYDVLCKHDVISKIFACVTDDYKRAKKILLYEEKNILDKNSIEANVAKVSSALLHILKIANKKLDEFNTDNIIPEGTDLTKMFDMLSKLK